MAFDPIQIRRQFPILEQTVHGHPLIYLDNAATTQMPEPVLQVILEQHRMHEANVHRGIHTLSERSTRRMEDARKTIGRLIGTEDPGEIIFTSGTTGAINLCARAFGEAFLAPGDEILTTALEHHANLIPWQEAARRHGALLRVLPFDENGNLLLDELEQYLGEKTKIVAVCAVSNVLGTVNPIREIIKAAHRVGAKVLIDGAQAMRHMPFDVKALDCDFLAFSGHKLMGPTGTGILYGKRELLEQLPPVEFGGGMVDEVTEEKATFGELPLKLEAGTPNIVGNIALGEAVSWYAGLAPEARQYEAELLAYTESQLRNLGEVQILGDPVERAGTISFLIPGLHPYDIAVLLDQLGIAVRSGHHCAQPLLRRFQLGSAVRVSPAFYNTQDEIDTLIKGLRRILPLVKP